MPVWLEAPEVVFFHRELIDEHGGLHGIRDKGALESTLARPRQRLNHDPEATICELAAAYGYGFTRNHVFTDGNKRVALAALNVFLLLVGCLMDIFSAIVVVVPLIAPISRHFGIDPIHLGIIFLANLELGYLTPPVGMNLFLSSFRFERPLTEVYRLAIPFLLILIVAVLLITYIPWLTLAPVEAVFGGLPEPPPIDF